MKGGEKRGEGPPAGVRPREAPLPRGVVITGERRQSWIRLGHLHIDPVGSTAHLGGRELPLTAKEFGLLLALARRPGAFVSRDRLMAEVWGDPGSRSRTLAIHVRRLRAKLGAYAAAIETRVRVGYRVNPALLREESGQLPAGGGGGVAAPTG